MDTNITLVTMLLLILVIEAAFSLYNNAIVVRANYRSHEDAVRKLRDEIKFKASQIDFMEDYLRKTKEREFASAFLITSDGIKALPVGWEKFLKDVWTNPPTRGDEG